MKRLLPPIKINGTYSAAQQDQLRALRLLAHAEIENYLEEMSEILVNDIERELQSASQLKTAIKIWAENAVAKTRRAIVDNNGVTDKSLQSLFSLLGISEKDFQTVSPVFLDRMREFGKNREDVAHRSALKATYQLNRRREEDFLNEIMKYLTEFDKLIIKKRLSGFVSR